jgi:hypothetical protein
MTNPEQKNLRKNRKEALIMGTTMILLMGCLFWVVARVFSDENDQIIGFSISWIITLIATGLVGKYRRNKRTKNAINE